MTITSKHVSSPIATMTGSAYIVFWNLQIRKVIGGRGSGGARDGPYESADNVADCTLHTGRMKMSAHGAFSQDVRQPL